MAFRKITPFVVLSLLLLLTACTAVSRDVVLKEIKDNPGTGAYIKDVPFFSQRDYMCGPASLASVTMYWGRGDAKVEDIATQIYLDRLKGTLPLDMLLYARKNRFDAEYYSGGMDDLKEKLSEGLPLILFLNLGLKSYPVGHYVVAVGYSDAAMTVLVHSGTEKEDTMSYRDLESAWSKTNYATLLVKPEVAR